jgi:hypothetical protein
VGPGGTRGRRSRQRGTHSSSWAAAPREQGPAAVRLLPANARPPPTPSPPRQVYRKAFRLNSAHGHEGGANVVSLVSTDCIKIYEGVQHCHNVWTAPLEAAVIIALLLWRTGGAYGLPALGVVVVVLPLQYYLGYRIATYKMANAAVSDGRVLRMHEILLAVKLVKFYVWERPFARQVEEVRFCGGVDVRTFEGVSRGGREVGRGR